MPRGWEMLRSERGFSAPVAEDYELTALAEAVREVGGAGRVDSSQWPDLFDGSDDVAPGRRGSRGRNQDTPLPGDDGPGRASQSARPRPGRRGHLRVLPDPTD